MIKPILKRRFDLFFILMFGLLFPAVSIAQVSFTMTGYTPNGCRPQNITFNATAAGANSYTWDFNDGTAPQITASSTISHNYTHGGYFWVHLVAYNGGTKLGDAFQNLSINGINGNLYSSMDSACVGEPVSFYVNGNLNNYQWDFGDLASGSSNMDSQSEPTHAFNAPGTYTVWIKTNTSCGMDSLSKVIVVNNSVNPNTQFWFKSPNCPNDPVEFGASNWHATNVSWNFGDPGSGANNTSTSSNPIHAYSTPGTYAVTFTITNPCGHTASRTDSVKIQTGLTWGGMNYNNNVGIYRDNYQGGPGSTFKGCPGDEFDFYTNTSAFAYTWDFGDGTPTSSVQRPVHIYGANGIYNLSLTLLNGCGNDTTIIRTVTIGGTTFGGNPGIDVYPDPACPNGKIMFHPKGPGKDFLWDFGDGITSSLEFPQHAYTTVGVKNISLKITNNCGIDTTVYYNLTISNSIVPTLTSGTNGSGNWGLVATTGCPGDKISAYAIGGTSYIFDFGDGFTTSSTSPLITGNGIYDIASHAYSTTGTFKVKLTYLNGCGNSAVDSTTITIGGSLPVTNPNVNTIDGGPFEACKPIRFIATGGVTYDFNFGNGDSLTTSNLITSYAYPVAGNYTITVKVTNGCGNSATVGGPMTINDIPLPTITISGDTLISSPASSYQWGLNGSSIAGATNQKYVATTSGSYSVTITNPNGCSATNSYQRCFVKAGPDVGKCSGASAQLNATGAISYSWSPSTGLSNTSIANPTANSGSDITYVVIGTTAGCPSVTDTIVVSNLGSLVANAGADKTICSGSSISLSGSGGGSYSWSPSTGLSSTTVPNPTANPTTTTTYTLTVNSGACNSTDQVIINVDNAPTVNAGSDNEICVNGTSVTLVGSKTNAAGLTWTGGTGTFSPNATTATATYTPSAIDKVNSPVILTLTTNGSGVCSAVSDQVSITITPFPVANAGPDQNISVSNATLSANTATSGTGAWSVANGSAIFTNPSNENTTVTGLSAGINKLVWTITNVCTAVSDTVVITSSLTGITNKVVQISTSNVYPNPFTDEVNFKFGNIQSNVVIKISDVAGKVVKTFEHDTTNDLKLGSDLYTGMYTIQIVYKDHVEVTRIVKIQ